MRTVRPGALIGASTVRGAFTEDIIRAMAEINQRPIIFALSNPTSKAECTAEDAYRITKVRGNGEQIINCTKKLTNFEISNSSKFKGTVLFASGSPFKNVELNGRIYKPGQGNNAYIFPGVALAVILFKVSTIDNKLFLMAARVSGQFFIIYLFGILFLGSW